VSDKDEKLIKGVLEKKKEKEKKEVCETETIEKTGRILIVTGVYVCGLEMLLYETVTLLEYEVLSHSCMGSQGTCV
jgi:hypothetical protein